MIVWVQLPALKVHFYHKEVLTILGNLIGRTIKLDYHTLTRQRAKFAHLAVEVDLSKPLVPRIWLDDEWQKVEFENLPIVCFECGKIGHSSDSCPLLQPVTSPAAISILGGASPDSCPELPEENPGYGPWMQVSRKSRRNSRGQDAKGKKDAEGGIPGSGKDGKSGKGGNTNKEGQNPLSQVAASNGHQPLHIGPQERKVGNGKHNGSDTRKGKEKVGSQQPPLGKGLLGPGPNNAIKNGQEPIAASETREAQPSTTSQNINGKKSNAEKKLGQVGDTTQKEVPHVMAPPPLTHSVVGPNGTTMQIIAVQPPGATSSGRKSEAAPSTASRTKPAKNSKSRGRKGSQAKLNSVRTLQIWSPVKEKRLKNKVRLANLTLQDINEWTEARGRPNLSAIDQTALEGPSQQPQEGVPEEAMLTTAS
ncbi:unnamed protein product [Linum tenue]|uniref:CCHC-type domain-containing protein n=1 Tax=Linum tenue TaxID=586396 RepID=A0AAV0IA41_9ROSI|nr:unnamed protein product [Linum tenue]